MIALTGGTGLLGSFLLPGLMTQGPVVALTRQQPPTESAGVRWVVGDVTDPLSLHEAFTGCDTVVHAAALVSFAARDRQSLLTTNVEGTANVVDACLACGVKRLIFISSVAALGRSAKSTVIDEQARWEPGTLNTAYGESKYLAELHVARGQEEGLSVAIVNPSVILAPAPADRSSGQLFHYVWNERPFYTAGSGNFVDVRDVCAVVMALVVQPALTGRYIASAGTLPWKDLFAGIAAGLHKRAPRMLVTTGWIRVAVVVERLRAALTGSSPLVTRETANMAQHHFVYKNDKAVSQLGIKFRDIRETLSWCCAELLQHPAYRE